MRVVATAALVFSLVVMGVGIGLFSEANKGWVAVTVPPSLTGVFGNRSFELWLPALIGGWMISALAIAVLVGWSLFYVWRRRQYESLILRLERELSELRNLPFTAPAPLEDLPEQPDSDAAELLAFADVRSRRGDGGEKAAP